MAAYSNPYEKELTAQLTTGEAGLITVTLLDTTGRTVLRRKFPGTPGRMAIALDEAPTMPSGAYVLLVHQNAPTGTVRVVRQ